MVPTGYNLSVPCGSGPSLTDGVDPPFGWVCVTDRA
jgi:hypothetical protein